ncbi:Hybrid signal transduction histidine kinase J [Seminavis robusta]|uniref:Hybrid signal transduction histidine kinase J n=1 Tax=Seminavis robusta TaxID=568900 RepID=A0A9N8HVW1_9STRA|nr:Hybrid signal transduction histidine kinase J [Seminavis robusta]|eukprot:Sro1556_g282210.1 Hybrid signal transduction histidine kinase J (1225) ;mRNA; f:3648-7639
MTNYTLSPTSGFPPASSVAHEFGVMVASSETSSIGSSSNKSHQHDAIDAAEKGLGAGTLGDRDPTTSPSRSLVTEKSKAKSFDSCTSTETHSSTVILGTNYQTGENHDIFPILLEESSNGDGGPNEDGSSGSSSSSSSSSSSINKATNDSATVSSSGTGAAAVAQTETKAVSHLRIFLLVFLALSAFGVALAVYVFTTRIELEQLKQVFDDHAATVMGALGGSLELTLGALDTYAIGLVSFAKFTGAEWPFVTLPNMAVRLAKLRTLSKSMAIRHYHIVHDQEQRLKWENYSIHHDDWVLDAMHAQLQDRNYHGSNYESYFAKGSLYNSMGENRSYDEEGPFLPTWQNYPVLPVWPPYNWDGAIYPELVEALPELLSMHVVLSHVTNLPNDPTNQEDAAVAEHHNQWAKEYLSPQDDPSEPFGDLFYPIMDCASDVLSMTLSHSTKHLSHEDHAHLHQSHDEHKGHGMDIKTVLEDHQNDGGDNCSLVGVLGVTKYWRDYLNDILPAGTKGLVAVFESMCGRAFTYQINGPDTEYLGPGTLHDTRFDTLKQTAWLHNLDAFSSRDRDYTGLPLGSDTCSYKISLYPSEEMLRSHTTSNPVAFTVVAVAIFAFTSCIFLLYDRYSERRQTLVMETAVQSNANVCILEEKVRERTKKLEDSNLLLHKANEQVTLASARQLQHFASMSHEIRTPLNGIIGLASLLQESKLDSKQEESMRMIVTSGGLLLRVVNDVLDYSKLAAGKVVIEVEQCQLQDTLNAVVRSIETTATSKRITLETYYDATIGETFQTDSRRLLQILYNLLGNASKFGSDGGIVELRVHHFLAQLPSADIGKCPETSDTKLEGMQEAPQQRMLRFVVKDYGKGIHEKDYEKIFQPFLQASSETERLYGGSGLGLAITGKLVKALGGRISVKSEVGKWTEMFVDFPLCDHTAPSADVAGLSSRLQGSTVYIVGDVKSRDVIETKRFMQIYSVDAQVFDTMKDAIPPQDQEVDTERAHVFLIQEDRYDEDECRRWSKFAKTVLLTFGHAFGVKGSDGHYRSLTQLLPSVLIKDIGDHVTRASQTQNPARTAGTSTKSTSDEEKEPSYKNYKILVAEDNLVNQKVVVRILKKLGILNVQVVDNGKKAVDEEADGSFNVILMDMQMPVMDGIDACRYITERQKRENDREGAKVIFVTAHALDHFKEKCQEAGGSGFLSKPFRLQDVESCFQKIQAMIDANQSYHEGLW